MVEHVAIDHHIQRHIIGVLIHRKFARFRDLRPPKTETNLFSYHLKALLKGGMVEKRDEGYTLSRDGLSYVDHVSIKKMNIRSQPKIISMLYVERPDGKVLLQRRGKQPYIDSWTLPYGKTHVSDPSVLAAARRELGEKLGIDGVGLRHVGDAYIRVNLDARLLTTTLAHVFRLVDDTVEETEEFHWVDVPTLGNRLLAPAVKEIVGLVTRADGRFFAELDVDWSD